MTNYPVPQTAGSYYEEMTVTPEMAREWLKHNIGNRPVMPKTVAQYMSLIARNQFKLTNDTITFSKSGRLLNGQHRLIACSRGTRAIRVGVMRNWDEANNIFDAGDKRTLSDTIGVTINNATGKQPITSDTVKLGVAVRFLLRYESGAEWPKLKSDEKEHVNQTAVDMYIRSHVSELTANLEWVKTATRGVSPRALSYGLTLAFYTIFARIDEALARQFMLEVLKGINLKANSATYNLRNVLLDTKNSAIESNRIRRYLTVIKAWNMYRAGRSGRVAPMHGDSTLAI